MVRIINAEDRAIADHNLAARIEKGGLPLLLLRLLLWRQRRAGANHADRVAVKLVDRGANLAQRVAELLLLLTPNRDLHEWQHTEGHDGQHGDRDHQLD